MMKRVPLCLALFLICVHTALSAPALQLIEFKSPPTLGMTAKVNPRNPSQEVRSDQVFFGGFSGITYDGPENSGKGYIFKINTDRGPTLDTVNFIQGTQEAAVPFVLPSFVPRIMSMLVNFQDGTAVMYDDITLFQGDGKNMTGLPNLQYSHQNLAFTDQFATDLFGNIQSNDPEGADLEGIVRASDGTYWLGDDYRASLYHFDQNGKLLKRYIPQGNATDVNGVYGTPTLPQVYASRRNDRGFKGVAIQGNILYAFMESPLDNPNTENNNVSVHSANIRILAFDTVKETIVAEYVYVLSEGVNLSGDSKVDKIGDVASLGNGKFLVVEQDSRSGKDAFKSIFEIDISAATNIHDQAKIIFLLPHNTTIEQAVFDKNLQIYPVSKRFIVNLATVGFDFAKVEGIAVFNSTSVVVVNDNDYQLVTNQFTANGTATFDRTRSSYIGLVTGLNFTSSFVTTSTTFNPTTTTTTGSFTTSTSGGVTTGGTTANTTTGATTGATTGTTTTTTGATTGATTGITGSTTSKTTGPTSTTGKTNTASAATFSVVLLLSCAIALLLM